VGRAAAAATAPLPSAKAAACARLRPHQPAWSKAGRHQSGSHSPQVPQRFRPCARLVRIGQVWSKPSGPLRVAAAAPAAQR
jgi:hypothetical protein